jgi:hypothetical protein
MKTLLVALISSDKFKGTREGAIHGLVGIGKEAERKGLVESGGVKVVGSEYMPGETGPRRFGDGQYFFIFMRSRELRIEDLNRLPYMICILHRTCLSH